MSPKHHVWRGGGPKIPVPPRRTAIRRGRMGEGGWPYCMNCPPLLMMDKSAKDEPMRLPPE